MGGGTEGGRDSLLSGESDGMGGLNPKTLEP